MIDSNDPSRSQSLGTGLQGDAGAAPDFENMVVRLDLEEIQSPEIPADVRWPVSHDPAGDAAPKAVGTFELGDDR